MTFSLSILFNIFFFFFFFFNDTATTEIYTLSLHDALPICVAADVSDVEDRERVLAAHGARTAVRLRQDRKSTRLNSSHITISYAVFCLKKKKGKRHGTRMRLEKMSMQL